MAKYASDDDLYSIVWSNKRIWESSGFLARQVAALQPIFRSNPNYSNNIEKTFMSTGHLDALRILKNFDEIRSQYKLSKDLNLYLSSKNKGRYQIYKFILLVDVLNSSQIRVESRIELKTRLIHDKIITDPVYIHKLDSVNF